MSSGRATVSHSAETLQDSPPTQDSPSAEDLQDASSPSAGILQDTPPHHVTGLLDTLTEHINAHLRYYRMLPWALGSLGVVLLLRYSGVPLKQLYQVTDIPTKLITENRKIYGVVKATSWNTLGVWHVPIWRSVLRWGTHPPGKFIFQTSG